MKIKYKPASNGMNKNIWVVILCLAIVGGVGFWFFNKTRSSENQFVDQSPVVTSGENAENGGQVHGLEPEPAATKAKTDLAAKLKIEEKSIVIMKVEEKTWNDGCLGLGGIAESCMQMLVDGFRVELLAQGKTYFYRTDKTGSSLRQE